MAVTSPEASANTAVRPTHLRCEYRVNPLGIDVIRPRLSWWMNDDRRGARQSAYRIVVSTDPTMSDPNQIVWDTDKVDSDRSIHIAYAGKPLASRQRYYWTVQLWDANGQPGEVSEPAWWEMGLLDTADWKARYVTAPHQEDPFRPDPEPAQWIWDETKLNQESKIWVRHTFTLPEGANVRRAVANLCADNGYLLYINGKHMGHGDRPTLLSSHEFAPQLQPGPNTVALHCWNHGDVAGLIFTARIWLEDGTTIDVHSDGSWKTAATDEPGWNSVDFDDSAWRSAKVIGSYGTNPWGELKVRRGPRRSVYMREDFQLKSNIKQARAYVTGFGLYHLHLNGKKAGDLLLTPGWTDYDDHVQYQTYDVTDLVQQGDNAVGAVLGNGWWSGGLGWGGSEQYSQENLRLLCQLEVTYEDGSQDVIVTNEDWKTHESPIVRDHLYHGEHYDARLEMPGWNKSGFDESDWTTVLPATEPFERLVAQRCEPVRVTTELEPAWISNPDPGVYIFDFGQNASGFCRLKVHAEAGTQIKLRFAEELDPNGRLYRDNYRGAEATDVYICKGGGEEVWEPEFTYRGFRYCELTGPMLKPPTKETLTFRVFHSDLPVAGSFECSHSLMTQIFENVAWGLRSNLHTLPTDCPQRDERFGWTGDALVFAPTSCWYRQGGAFYTKWMRDVTDSQDPEEGWVRDVAPAIVLQGPAAPGWGDAVVSTPWTVYRFYGDTRILEDNYDAMVKWIEYMHRERDPNSGLYEREGYGDWVASVDSPKKPIGAAYYYHSTKVVSQMAAVLGKQADADKYASRAEEIARLFNEKFFDPTSGWYEGRTQTANLLPLHFGMVPKEHEQAVLDRMVEDIVERGDHLSTGFLGTAYLMTALANHDQQDVAYRLAQQTRCPSWGYMIRHGATTMWERWDTDKHGPGMNSRNHYAFGAVSRWMMEDVGGITLEGSSPGFKQFHIAPQPGGDLLWAKASYDSMHGPVSTHWRYEGSEWLLSVTIPANTTGRIVLPAESGHNATVTESDERIVENGKPVSESGTISVAEVREDSVVLEVPAGSYEFKVTMP